MLNALLTFVEITKMRYFRYFYSRLYTIRLQDNTHSKLTKGYHGVIFVYGFNKFVTNHAGEL